MHFDSIKIDRTEGISDKTPFSRLMCEALALDIPKRLLDIGCGSGIIGLFSLLNDCEYVYFNDIQQEAVELTLRNLNRHRFDQANYQILNIPFQDLDLNDYEIDTIAFNPPQLPTALVEIEQFQERSERVFRDGGITGRDLIDSYISWLAKNLTAQTKAYLGISSVLMVDDVINQATALGLKTIIAHSKIVPLREIFYSAVKKMPVTELRQREISKEDGKFYKKIYVLNFAK